MLWGWNSWPLQGKLEKKFLSYFCIPCTTCLGLKESQILGQKIIVSHKCTTNCNIMKKYFKKVIGGVLYYNKADF